MDKKTFIKLMQELVSIKEDEDNLNKAFKKFNPDFNYISFGRYEELVVKCLEQAMDDKNDWISYWLYELDCGKESKRLKVKDKKGKIIPTKTINDLYNIIENKNI